MNRVLLLASVALFGYCLGRENVLSQKLMANSPIMQIKKSVDKKLCAEADYPEDVVKKVEDCDQFDPHYKIDMMYKECQDMLPKGQLSWNERRKSNCKVRDCYEQKFNSPEYNKTWDEIRKLSDFEIEKRQIQKFECLAKAL